MSAGSAPTPMIVQLAVVLDDPTTIVSTDGLFASVIPAGGVALGPAVGIGDVAEWVFDAVADSFETAFDLLHRAVLEYLDVEHGAPVELPDGVQVFVWTDGEPFPDGYTAWCAARGVETG